MVDPIDGTNAFLRHVPEWTVSAALVEDGKPVIGVVTIPPTKQFFSAMRGKRRLPQRPADQGERKSTLEGALFIASGGLFKKKHMEGAMARVESRWVNSVAYRLALVACGEADATISLSAKCEWDLAAGALIVDEAGGIITDHHGKALPLQSRPPRACRVWSRAPPELHAQLIERTSRVDL